MNIFYVDESPETAAQMMCDKHVVKMILESAQLLSTAHRLLDDNPNEILYKVTHKNHPSAVWTRQSFLHYSWLYKHFVALCDEYTYRYGKIHKTDSKLRKILRNYPQKFSTQVSSWKEPPCCMPEDSKISLDTVDNYRQYYKTHKKHIHKWTKRNTPDWI